MEKRLFNKLGFETSLLGLGCMRFPQKNGKIDLLETEKLVDACMAGGINYFDTAYVYGDGDSENAVKRTLVERYPTRALLSCKQTPHVAHSGGAHTARALRNLAQAYRCDLF